MTGISTRNRHLVVHRNRLTTGRCTESDWDLHYQSLPIANLSTKILAPRPVGKFWALNSSSRNLIWYKLLHQCRFFLHFDAFFHSLRCLSWAVNISVTSLEVEGGDRFLLSLSHQRRGNMGHYDCLFLMEGHKQIYLFSCRRARRVETYLLVERKRNFRIHSTPNFTTSGFFCLGGIFPTHFCRAFSVSSCALFESDHMVLSSFWVVIVIVTIALTRARLSR